MRPDSRNGGNGLLAEGQDLPSVAVVLSDRLERFGTGLDLLALQEWLASNLVDVRVAILSGAGRGTGIARLMESAGTPRLVFGLAPGDPSFGTVQAQVRKVGFDQLGFQLLNLGAHAGLWHPPSIALERAKLLLAGAVARVRAFGGSRPEHLKASLSVSLSRRSLFTLSVDEYCAVPSVSTERCVAGRGCRRCVGPCPAGALHVEAQHISLDRTRCVGCGICTTICPTDAVDFPGSSAAQVEAQIAGLLNPSLGGLAPRGVLFACQRGLKAMEDRLSDGRLYPGGWLPVAVSCTGAVTLGQLFWGLACGAGGVAVLPCGRQCPFGQDAVAERRVAVCRDIIGQLGAGTERVRICAWPEEGSPGWGLDDLLPTLPVPGFIRDGQTSVSGPLAASLLHLASINTASADIRLEDTQAPFGSVDLDIEGCTLCEACANACPTGALRVEVHSEETAISFDMAQCNACGICVQRCPESARGVLHLRPLLDLQRLEAGRVVLHRGRTSHCLACGSPIAPTAMMTRLKDLLGEQFTALESTISGYCVHCRGLPQSTQESHAVGGGRVGWAPTPGRPLTDCSR